MKKLSLLLCLTTVCAIGHAQDMGNAAKHVAAGAAIGAVGGYAAYKIFDGRRGWAWAGAVGGSLTAGLAKETYDTANGAIWENSDVLYTVLGGFISGVALDLLLDRRRSSAKKYGCPPLAFTLPKVDVAFVSSSVTHGSGNIASAIQANYLIKSGL